MGRGKAFSEVASLPSGCDNFLYYDVDMYPLLIQGSYVAANTIIVRRQLAGDVFRFPEDLETYECWECFARLARVGKCAFLDCETACQHGHSGPRLTDADKYVCASTRLRMTERVWGNDEVFLRDHGEIYRTVLEKQYILMAEALMARGYMNEARKHLVQVSR